MPIADMFKSLANAVGARLPRKVLSQLGSLVNYLYTGRWMSERGLTPRIRVQNRVELIKTLSRRLRDQEVLYLEFGVWKGESMQLWSKLLQNPLSRLHGFDSFEGLPEAWDNRGASGRSLSKGHFSTCGAVPEIPDPRVKFFKGWFENTLAQYDFLPGQVLVLFMDSDLYVSTIYVLQTLRPHIKVGTIIYFDEFWDPLHEQRAFTEFLDQTGMKFEALVADYGTRHVAFERVS